MFRFALAGLLILSSAVAMADGLNYNYIQAAYQEVDIDLGGGFDVDGDGFGIGGSAAINDDWFIFAGYSTFDFESVVDLSSLTIGGGYRAAASDKTDWFATLGYAQAEVDVQGFSSEDDGGYAVSVGLRSMVSENVELYGSLGYADLGGGADGTSIAAGFWYSLSGNVALGLGVDFDDDVTAYGVGFRLYFDR
ncbi:MAG: outer membrane beta-barrel protein [Woeseiaceae bacterium]|nr:outer membrane beta-barrel protein [Woeseiaceae bacterium]